jgi:hypothetical protein
MTQSARTLKEDTPESATSGTTGLDDSNRAGLIDDLDILSTGTLGWLRNNIKLFDPSSANRLPATLKVKSSLELAQLCRLWARFRPDDAGLHEVTSFVREIWQHPDFSQLVAADTSSDGLFALVYGAYAPTGVTSGFHRAALAELVANGDLTAQGRSPYSRLETRYFAELAGVDHQIESYAELYAASILAELAATDSKPISEYDAYAITHTIWQLTDFGFRDPDLTDDDRERALGVVDRLTRFCVRNDKWDLLGEFLLARFCLDRDLTHSTSVAAGIKRLRQVQLASGAIPGRSAERRPAESATVADFFQTCYHPTMVASMASLAISFASKMPNHEPLTQKGGTHGQDHHVR